MTPKFKPEPAEIENTIDDSEYTDDPVGKLKLLIL
jgi:hypothetical protein